MNHSNVSLHIGCLALFVAACGGSADGVPGDSTPNTASADLLYVGACTPAECDGPVPELGCADRPGEYVCSASNGAACSIHLECPAGGDDPDQSTSFAACEDAECGASPSEPVTDCPAGYSWSAPRCGSLDDNACAWGTQCTKKPAARRIDATKLGKACDASSGPCDGSQQCVSFEGVEGAHCVQDPCALLACPADKCVSMESYPVQVRCTE